MLPNETNLPGVPVDRKSTGKKGKPRHKEKQDWMISLEPLDLTLPKAKHAPLQ